MKSLAGERPHQASWPRMFRWAGESGGQEKLVD